VLLETGPTQHQPHPQVAQSCYKQDALPQGAAEGILAQQAEPLHVVIVTTTTAE